MADEEKKEDQTEENIEPVAQKKSSFFSQKIILVGLPIFIVQLVAVYFITANFLLNRVQGYAKNSTPQISQVKGENAGANKKVELGKFIYLIEDIIVNPMGTEGKKLLLASIGFDLSSEEEQK